MKTWSFESGALALGVSLSSTFVPQAHAESMWPEIEVVGLCNNSSFAAPCDYQFILAEGTTADISFSYYSYDPTELLEANFTLQLMNDVVTMTALNDNTLYEDTKFDGYGGVSLGFYPLPLGGPYAGFDSDGNYGYVYVAEIKVWEYPTTAGQSWTLELPPPAVPEPETWALMTLGGLALAAMRRRAPRGCRPRC